MGMYKRYQYAAIITLLSIAQNTHGFIFNLFRDLTLLEGAVSDINRKNRQAVVDSVRYVYNSVKHGVSNTINTVTASNSEIDSEPMSAVTDRSNAFKTFTFKDLAGYIPIDVREIVDFLKYPERFRQVGAQMPRGVLLVGPPGTGKTSIAKAIAGEAKAHFFDASATQFIELYVGNGPKNIRELFERARDSVKFGAYKKAIIFIDELDAIGGCRAPAENAEYRNTLNELLHQMDGFKQDDSIMVIGATNTPDMLDAALLRPGRFDRIVEISLPSKKSREKILLHYAKQKPCDSDVDFKKLALLTEGYSGAELKNLVNEAAVHAGRENAKKIAARHFDSVMRHLNRSRRSFK